MTVCSCTALDEAPDNRTEITSSPEKIRQLLTSGYPVSVPAVLTGGDYIVTVESIADSPYTSVGVTEG